MDDVAIFEEFVTQTGLGLRLDLGNPDSNRGKFYGWWARRANQTLGVIATTYPKLPAIHFNIVDRPDLNACAFRSRDRYFIGFNAGTIFIIDGIAKLMMSHPAVASAIGDPSRESAERA